MTITPGKLAGMKAVANERGVIAAAAMDQRGSLQKAMAKEKGGEISDAMMEEFKSLVTEVLTSRASAILRSVARMKRLVDDLVDLASMDAGTFAVRRTAQDVTGALREIYDRMRERPLPPVYRPSHGGAPGIVQAHSLDPALIPKVFGTSTTLNGAGPLSWPERELINATTSRLNQCLY